MKAWQHSQEVVGQAEGAVEPVDLAHDELLGHEAALGQDLGHGLLLVRLERERRRLVAADGSQLRPPRCTEM